jgi:hypothetical protein
MISRLYLEFLLRKSGARLKFKIKFELCMSALVIFILELQLKSVLLPTASAIATLP